MKVHIAFKDGTMGDNVIIPDCTEVSFNAECGMIFVTIPQDPQYQHITLDGKMVDGADLVRRHMTAASAGNKIAFNLTEVESFINKED